MKRHSRIALLLFATALWACSPKEEKPAEPEPVHEYEKLSSVTAKATSTEKSFSADLDVIVSFTQGQFAFFEDKSGGVMVKCKGHGLMQGDEIKGIVSGKIIAYDGNDPYKGPGLPQITSIDVSKAEVSAGSAPTTVITVKDLTDNYNRYASCKVRFNGICTTSAMDAANTTGEFIQNGKTMVLAAEGTKETIIYKGRTGDIIGFPYINKDGKCLLIFGTSNFIERDLPAEESKFTALTKFGAYDLSDENNPKVLFEAKNGCQYSARSNSTYKTAHVSSVLENKDIRVKIKTNKISCGSYQEATVFALGIDGIQNGDYTLCCVKKENGKVWLKSDSDKKGYIIPVK